jgi:hypothetical protein
VAVRFIEKNEDSIRESVDASASSSANFSGEILEEMERAWCVCVAGAEGCQGVRQGGLSRQAVEG